MPSITNGFAQVSFSIGAKDSSGNFTISASFYNSNALNSIGNVRLSCSLTDSSPWTQINVGTISPHGSKSGSTSIASGNTSSQTVYCYLLYTNSSSGYGGGYPVEGYVDPTPPFTKKTISVSPSTVVMGNAVNIYESSGVGVSSTTNTWRAGSGSGSFSTGSWNISPTTFEPLCPNAKSLSITFTVYSSGEGGSGSSSATITANVPSDYLPTADYTYDFINPQNNSLVAGFSSLRVTLNPYMTPDNNSASITSVTLSNVVTTNTAVTVNSFTQSGNVFTSSVLPTMTNVPSYTIQLVFSITDSRGNTIQYTTESFRVTNFIPPYCMITSLTRDSATTGTLHVYISTPSAPSLATVKVGNNTAVNVLNQLVRDSQNPEVYTLTYAITGLSSGNQYNVTFSFRNADMVTYGENAYAYTQLLSTMAMPISLYDNGTRMAVSFGEECADNYGQNVVINFAKDAYLRYVRNNVAYVEKVEDVFYSCPFPVGGIYISTDSTNPNTIWAGTTWSAIAEGRVLIGAGTGNDGTNSLTVDGGDTGGEYQHTLTINEMPSHTHPFSISNNPKFDVEQVSDGKTIRDDNQPDSYTTSATGGGQSHNIMQPYLGVYMWERTA